MENSKGINKAKRYQIALFPFNNAATNCYMTLLTFVTYYGTMYLSGSVVGSLTTALSLTGLTAILSAIIMGMRIFDGITDPILGAIMDKTRTKFGKFRPYMIVGNAMLALSITFMMIVFRGIRTEWLRWCLFIICYIVYVLGYTCQCACTKAGQTCITNDPKQRSQFIVWNMVGMIGSIVLINVIGNGLLLGIVPKVTIGQSTSSCYNPLFYDILVPFTVILSAIYTGLAVYAIREKDKPEFWGIEENTEPASFREYASLLKENDQIRWLVISAACNKLASTVATSGSVAYLLYGCLMDDYNGLFIPMYALSFLFMGLFFLVGSKTAGEKGHKRAVAQYTSLAFIFYVGLVVLLLIFDKSNPATHLMLYSLSGGFHLTINPYTVFWIVLFGCGYGAYNCCSEMCIPMVADCTDYETYRSGNYMPGIMGTIFSLIDKLVSSLSAVLITLFTVGIIPELTTSIGEATPYMSGMKLSAIICFCLLPMAAWLVTVICMFFYKLSGNKLKEIQAVNAVRKEAIKGGMSKEEAMAVWKTIDQVPLEFVAHDEKVPKEKKRGVGTIFDTLYFKLWGKSDETVEPASKAIEIPEKYRL